MTEVETSGSAGMQEAGILVPTTSTAASSPTVRTTHPFDDHSSQSSFASQLSAPNALKLSTADVSPSAVPPPVPEDLTPPSSNASPTREQEHGQAKAVDQPTGNETIASVSYSARVSPSPSASGSQSEGTAGKKRTASGQVKIIQHTEPAADSVTTQTRHARASCSLSATSNGNVTEISQQLRTRLKYAMVKVQHGWQTRSLDELESLASASPKSNASPNLHAPSRASPFSPSAPPVLNSKMSRKWSDSSSSEDSRSDQRLSALTSSTVPSTGPLNAQHQRVRSLAPPADIIPGTVRRRPTPNEVAWHSLSSHAHPSHPSSNSRPSSQRTPSQNAAMEADAVETLLFMASPNNSSYHGHPHPQPPSSSQVSQESSLRSALNFPSAQPQTHTQVQGLTSPLRTQFSQTSVTSPKKVAFQDQTLAHPAIPMLRSERKGPREAKDDLIDAMIDSVRDDSEDDTDLDIHRVRPTSEPALGQVGV